MHNDRTKLMRLLLSLQADSGAFFSTVHRGESSIQDYNGFVTALVLRELEPLPELEGWPEARERALDFLEECESPFLPGFFAFWPRHRWPEWAPVVPDDADDTAVIASELLQSGRIDVKRAQDIASTVLIPYRLDSAPAQPAPHKPWIRPGAFLTWLNHACEPNPMDCCVNVNVLAFLAQTGLTGQPGYKEACQMVFDGISWSARRWQNLEQLSPYYPEAAELVAALNNALRRGATALAVCLQELAQFPVPPSADHASKILFSIADRSTQWSSRAVWAARRLAKDLHTHRATQFGNP
jgi:hypothetical protein